MIKALLTISIVLGTLLPLQAKSLGVGIIVGEPTGICFKIPQAANGSVILAAAWSLDNFMHLHADYIVDNRTLITDYAVAVYYGLGVRLITNNDPQIGIRIPIGINYQIANSPLDVFFELAPILNLIPNTDFDINAAIGLRFFFN